MSDKRTTKLGYENINQQRVMENTLRVSTNHNNQRIYRMKCLKCGHQYGANGCDVHLHRCPKCDGGAPGLYLPIKFNQRHFRVNYK